MNITAKNLQEFCRICLNKVILNAQNEGEAIDAYVGYDIFLIPNLAKLVILFTSLNVDENDGFPRKLCHFCYTKLKNINDFRLLALKSTEFLRELISQEQERQRKEQQVLMNNENGFGADDDFDNQLLLPELAVLDRAIKSESIMIGEEGVYTPPPPAAAFNYEIKHLESTVDSEFEEEQERLGNELNNIFSYDQRADDADDEEPFRSRPEKRRKRDRTKKCLKCPLCGKQAYKQAYLDAHIRSVHEGLDRPFVCETCNKSFTRYNHLHQHRQSHEKRFACEFDGCKASFKLIKTLELHVNSHFTKNNDATTSFGLQEVIELRKEEVEMEHLCKKCLKKYSSKRALNEHLKRHAQIKDHVCKVCGVAKVTRTELSTHMRIHEKNLEKFKCHLCPQEFNHKNAISRHVRVVHEGVRRYACSYCNKRFGTRNSQVCHERLHTGERPFNCETCGKGFAQVEGLKSHMKNHDKNLRKYVCSFCSQRFITRKNLLDHEQRHTGSKPYICRYCSKGHFKQEDLTIHEKSHTELEGDSATFPEDSKIGVINNCLDDAMVSEDSNESSLMDTDSKDYSNSETREGQNPNSASEDSVDDDDEDETPLAMMALKPIKLPHIQPIIVNDAGSQEIQPIIPQNSSYIKGSQTGQDGENRVQQ